MRVVDEHFERLSFVHDGHAALDGHELSHERDELGDRFAEEPGNGDHRGERVVHVEGAGKVDADGMAGTAVFGHDEGDAGCVRNDGLRRKP